MLLEKVVLQIVRSQLARPFENRWQRFTTWSKVVVRVDGGGQSGVGECTAMETPFYNYETVETAWHILSSYLVPLALDADDAGPLTVAASWRHINGHEEAKGALECALWDLRARLVGEPLARHLGGRLQQVPVGATVGIEPSIGEVVAAVARAADSGYHRVRVKIRPGWDNAPLRAVRAELPDLPIIADANGAYEAEHLDLLTSLDDLELLAVEQPFARDEIELTATLQARMDTTVCLDEAIKSLADVRRAQRAGACRMVNIKVGRVGGLAEAKRIHDFCQEHGLPTFVGAKYELGVGRWTNLALATLPNMTLPSDVGPSSRYYLADGVRPSLSQVAPGWTVPLPAPGIGATRRSTSSGICCAALGATGRGTAQSPADPGLPELSGGGVSNPSSRGAPSAATCVVPRAAVAAECSVVAGRARKLPDGFSGAAQTPTAQRQDDSSGCQGA